MNLRLQLTNLQPSFWLWGQKKLTHAWFVSRHAVKMLLIISYSSQCTWWRKFCCSYIQKIKNKQILKSRESTAEYTAWGRVTANPFVFSCLFRLFLTTQSEGKLNTFQLFVSMKVALGKAVLKSMRWGDRSLSFKISFLLYSLAGW